jgi:Fic family protein
LRETGNYIECRTAGEPFKAFIPHPLPPVPELQLSDVDYVLLERASRALGKLDGLSVILPDMDLFTYIYVRKEAVLSSQIEGTQSSLSQLLLFESSYYPGLPLDDVSEVSNYVAALNHGIARIKDGFPVSLRLIRDVHGVLLSSGRGSDRAPGEFRKSQNWIGGSRPGNAAYVPPPPEQVVECMGALELFIHQRADTMPLLIQLALVHAQFETIHPFLDGNGRIGRLLITLILLAHGALTQPVLYLSLYFKQHRQEYYSLLQQIRLRGSWEKWIQFFLEGVAIVANQACATVTHCLDLFKRDEARIREELAQSSLSALRVLSVLKRRPISSIPALAKSTELSQPTVAKAIRGLEELNVVVEITAKKRDRVYCYQQYFERLNEGIDAAPE